MPDTNKSKPDVNVDYTNEYKPDDFADYGVRYDAVRRKSYCANCGKELIQPKPTSARPYPRRFCCVECAHRYYRVDQRSPYSHWVGDSCKMLEKLWDGCKDYYDRDLENFKAQRLGRFLVRLHDAERFEDDLVGFAWDRSRILTKEEMDDALAALRRYMRMFMRVNEQQAWRAHDLVLLCQIVSRMWLFKHLDNVGCQRPNRTCWRGLDDGE